MKYLLWCANAHINFRIPELKAIASFYKIPIKWMENRTEEPYIIVELNKEEDARKLASRSMLVRGCYELWSQGKTADELHSNLKKNIPKVKHHITNGIHFRLSVMSFNKKLSQEEKYDKVMSFDYMPFEGKVNLTNPEMILSLIEYYGICPNNVPDTPYRSFFGRWLVDGQRELLNSFTLKKRSFIGTTSMDAELAFLMTNVAQVGPGDVVVDPFVGTGSILVSAAQRGSFVWGWDIDFLTLHAKTKPTRFNEKARKPNESIYLNLKQYGLQHRYLDALVMDSSKHLWRQSNIIDAIVTDPPYGIRESTERVGNPKERKRKFSAEEVSTELHYPSKMNYDIADIMVDLLNFSVGHLKLGGRLVFWLPVFREDYSDQLIPSHPCLKLEYNCEQILSTHSSRRLITLIKIREAEVSGA
ncbi:UNVERIFIED_CONTAM: hypothetical protein GTU68_015563, partial [Idotea baltica]|nr:hypothetical protein [Idotea baltica]